MELAQYIDHTILKPQTTVEEINKLCTEADIYHFKAVCVPPYFVAESKGFLKESSVLVATVIGFPFGYSNKEAKVAEVKFAIDNGADELDMVINIAALKNKDYQYVQDEITLISNIIHQSGKHLKVIIESGILIDDEIIRCCDICTNAQADFVKTSTGYAEVGATIHAVELIRKNIPQSILIKASGVIRTKEIALKMIEAGATRIGTSSGVAIINTI